MDDESIGLQEAKAQLANIRKLVAACEVDYDLLRYLRELNAGERMDNAEEIATLKELETIAGDNKSFEDAVEALQQTPLSIRIRDGWYSPDGRPSLPQEYEILLCCGGPSIRIVGELDEYEGPMAANLEYLAWGNGWITYNEPHIEAVLLSFARFFYLEE